MCCGRWYWCNVDVWLERRRLYRCFLAEPRTLLLGIERYVIWLRTLPTGSWLCLHATLLLLCFCMKSLIDWQHRSAFAVSAVFVYNMYQIWLEIQVNVKIVSYLQVECRSWFWDVGSTICLCLLSKKVKIITVQLSLTPWLSGLNHY